MGPDAPDGVCPVCAIRGALALSDGSAEAAVLESPGDRIGRYRLTKQLGEGGYGVVYLAEQTEPLRREVALKVIKPGMDTRQVIARFEAERQALARMEHPNIAQVFDAGATATGRPYFVMELVRGRKITEYCDEHNLSARERLDLFMQVCHAVQHAHQKGIIHRDLKPSNILVARPDPAKPGVPKVIDFGIAKAIQEPLSDGTSLTAAQQFVGTLAYMSPEQAGLDGQDIDTRCDVYALGVLLYELLTGHLPFEKKELQQAGLDEMRRLIREKEPPKPSTRLSLLTADELTTVAQRQRTEPPRLLLQVRGDLDWIVMKCLEKERGRRYETPNGLARDLERHLNHEPVRAAAPSVLYRMRKFIRRHRFGIAAAAMVVVLAVGAMMALGVAQGLRVQRDAARQVTALRNAELAARNGQWRESLRYLDEAAAAGYADAADLGLQRAEAWTVLTEPERSRAELVRLVHRSDLGQRRSLVLLRWGEHEMFDQATANQGVRDVREALRLGLAGADGLFAQGLLAETTPEALDYFHRALQVNSFHHGAHRHSLGLEYVLGHHAELRDHCWLFVALYPEDPSARFLEAAELAAQGRLEEADKHAAALSASLDTDTLRRVLEALPKLAAAARRYDLDLLLSTNPAGLPRLEPLQATDRALCAPPNSSTENKGPARMAQLPSIQSGLLEGRAALTALMLPFLGDIESSVSRIKASWQRHPEALVPAMAGIYLQTRQPTNGPPSIRLLALQGELFQLAAGSSSVLPSLGRTARYLAARTEFELCQRGGTNASSDRSACVGNIRQAVALPEASPAELQAYFSLAVGLDEHALARELLARWSRLEGSDPRLTRARIELEMASGSLDAALRLIEKALAGQPQDAWLQTRRETALRELDIFLDSYRKNVHDSR